MYDHIRYVVSFEIAKSPIAYISNVICKYESLERVKLNGLQVFTVKGTIYT